MKAKITSFSAVMIVVAALTASGPLYGQRKDQDLNALMSQAQTAVDERKWQQAIATLQQLTSADPSRWEFFQKLGYAQLNLGRYEDAVRTYEKGLEAAQWIVSNPAGREADAAKAKAGMAQILTQEGNAYIKLRKSNEAIAAYTRAAEMSTDKSLAYFNICATLYNLGNMDQAEGACDKAIAFDPTRADAYFIAGSMKFAKGEIEPKTNKFRAPPGTAEALRKYLELAPNGPHAKDAKEMLEMIDGKTQGSTPSPGNQKR